MDLFITFYGYSVTITMFFLSSLTIQTHRSDLHPLHRIDSQLIKDGYTNQEPSLFNLDKQQKSKRRTVVQWCMCIVYTHTHIHICQHNMRTGRNNDGDGCGTKHFRITTSVTIFTIVSGAVFSSGLFIDLSLFTYLVSLSYTKHSHTHTQMFIGVGAIV